MRNVSVLAAIGVDSDGFRQLLGVAVGEQADLEGWWVSAASEGSGNEKRVRLTISDAFRGLVEAAAEEFAETEWWERSPTDTRR